MSLTVAGGLILGDPGTYQHWDPTLSQNPEAASQDNRGCAPGWATIYVVDSVTGQLVRVCRRLDEAILGPGGAAIIAEESGPDWYDQTLINVADASRQVVEGGEAVFEALTPAMLSGALLVGALALAIFAFKR